MRGELDAVISKPFDHRRAVHYSQTLCLPVERREVFIFLREVLSVYSLQTLQNILNNPFSSRESSEKLRI